MNSSKETVNPNKYTLTIQDSIKNIMDKAKEGGHPFLKGKRNSYRQEVVLTIAKGESKLLAEQHGNQSYGAIKEIVNTPEYRAHLRDMLRVAEEE